MKSCVGCRHYVSRFSVCSAADGQLVETKVSLFDGKVNVYYGLRPSIDEMRAPAAACGPDASLYQPTLLQRLKDRFKETAK